MVATRSQTRCTAATPVKPTADRVVKTRDRTIRWTTYAGKYPNRRPEVILQISRPKIKLDLRRSRHTAKPAAGPERPKIMLRLVNHAVRQARLAREFAAAQPYAKLLMPEPSNTKEEDQDKKELRLRSVRAFLTGERGARNWMSKSVFERIEVNMDLDANALAAAKANRHRIRVAAAAATRGQMAV